MLIFSESMQQPELPQQAEQPEQSKQPSTLTGHAPAFDDDIIDLRSSDSDADSMRYIYHSANLRANTPSRDT